MQLQQSVAPANIDPLETPTFQDVDSILNTPAPLDIDSSLNVRAMPSAESSVHSTLNTPAVSTNESLVHSAGEDVGGYTEMLATDRLDDHLPDEVFTRIKSLKTDSSLNIPQNEESPSSSARKKITKAAKIDVPPRRTLRSGKSIQASDIVENLPRVKTVLTKLKKAEYSKRKTKEIGKKVEVIDATKAVSSKEKAQAICEKALSDAKSRADSKQQVVDSVKELKVKVETPKTEPAKYLCRLCKDTFDAAEDLKAHVQLHKSLACHMCKKIFKTKESVEEHKQAHRDKNEYNECDKCEEVFKYPWQLGEHVEKVHENVEEMDGEYPCTRCGHVFRKMTYLNEHNERNRTCADEGMEVQQNVDNALLSEIQFTDLSGLQKKKTVKELMENSKLPATCQICQKTFDKLYNFKRHVLHHSEVKPHKCVICGQCFQVNFRG